MPRPREAVAKDDEGVLALLNCTILGQSHLVVSSASVIQLTRSLRAMKSEAATVCQS